MANDLKLNIAFTGDDTSKPATESVKKNIQSVTDATEKNAVSSEKSATKIEQSNKKVSTSYGGLLSSISKVKLGVIAVGAAVVGIVSQMGKWTDAANIQTRAEVKLSTTLTNLTKASSAQIQSLKDQASALQALTGFSDEQIISAQAILGTFKLTSDQIKELTPLLLDMAESSRKLGDSNVDLESIASTLGETLNKGIGSLSEYGLSMSKAQEESFKLASQSQKVSIITQVLNDSFGGLAESVGNTYEGAVRKGDAAQGNFLETLGLLFTQNTAFVQVQNLLTASWISLSEGVSGSSKEIGIAITAVSNGFNLFANSIKLSFNIVQIAVKTVAALIIPPIELIVRTLSLITFGNVSGAFNEMAIDLRLFSRDLKTGIQADFKDIGDAVNGLSDTFTNGSVGDGIGLATSVKKESQIVKNELNALINQRIGLEKKLAIQTKKLAVETSTTQIKQGKKVVSALENDINKSISLQQQLSDEIIGRQNKIDRINETSSDKLRRLDRQGRSERFQQADIELQATEQLAAAKKAAATDPQEASRLAKKAEQTAQELDSQNSLILIIKKSRDIQIEAQKNAIARAEESKVAEQENQKALEQNLKSQKQGLQDLLAIKTELEKPTKLDINDNIAAVTKKIDALQKKLSSLGGTINISASSSQNSDVPAAHGGLGFVPKESTFLLDKGERVLSPNQNADLVAFLKSQQTNRIANVASSTQAVSSQTNNSNSININLPGGQSFGPFQDSGNNASALQAALEIEVLKRGRRR